MSLDEIHLIAKQLEGEVQMYDALTREYGNGNREAVDLDEVREWSMRNLEVINKALFSIQKRRRDDFADKKARDDAINTLFYLKERITAIEKAAMVASPFRSVSPKGRDRQTAGAPSHNISKYGAGPSEGTAASAASPAARSQRDNERDNPFNQVIRVTDGAGQSHSKHEYGGEISGCSSAARRPDGTHAIEDPSYFSSLKEREEPYRTFDPRERSAGEDDKRITRSDLSKKPY